MSISKRQELADKFTNEAMTAIYGERFTSLEDVEEDEELNKVWETLNEGFYNTLLNL